MYGKHFGLEELPFSVTPDPRFFFNNSLYREAFASLRYGIETRKGFIVITGEAGTGKTTLLRRLMRSVEATVHTGQSDPNISRCGPNASITVST